MIYWNVVFQEGVSWFENRITDSTQVFTDVEFIVLHCTISAVSKNLGYCEV
jgi:hypothetical protein